ncbi:MAG: restriction endonuclease subunit S [Actinomycetota bacterium]
MAKTRAKETGRPASTGVIPGRYALSVGNPGTEPPTGWSWVRLTDVARLETGHTPSRRHPEYWGGDIPWVASGDATEHRGETLLDTKEHTNDAGIANSSARILPEHTVCLCRTASVGHVVVLGRPMATSQDFVNWVCSDDIDWRFLRAVLLAERDSFLRFATGTTHQTIYFPEVKAFHACLPPRREQAAIGGLIQDLDDKIDVNRRISETLEEIARALFTSWFVDFDPVRGTSTVPEDIRRLFPDRLVDSTIGPVPEGWQVAPLGEHVEVTRGLSYTGAGLADEGMPLHNLNSIREGGGYKEDGIKHYVGEYRDRDRVRPGDVIVANTDLTQNARVIGSPAIIPRSFGDDGLYSHHIYRVHALDGSPLTRRWLYLLLVVPRMHQQVAGYSNGTTVNMLPKDGLTRPLIAAPPPELVEHFESIIAPMFEQQETLTAESKTLAALRDTLLPKLISGELRLKEAS